MPFILISVHNIYITVLSAACIVFMQHELLLLQGHLFFNMYVAWIDTCNTFTHQYQADRLHVSIKFKLSDWIALLQVKKNVIYLHSLLIGALILEFLYKSSSARVRFKWNNNDSTHVHKLLSLIILGFVIRNRWADIHQKCRTSKKGAKSKFMMIAISCCWYTCTL